MSFSLEFYSLSWDALKSALTQRKPELIHAVQEQQWDRLLGDTNLGAPTHHVYGLMPTRLTDTPSVFATNVESHVLNGFDDLAEAMSQKLTPGHEPPDLSDGAALVFAAIVRQLGKPIGAINHMGSVVRDADGEFPLDFREMFLDGIAGTCFGDHQFGEKLAARPLFGLFHLDFLSWGGLSQGEIGEFLGKYRLPPEIKRDEDWQPVAANAEGWLNDIVKALKAASDAKTDLVTLYLTEQKHFDSFREEVEDDELEDFPFLAGSNPSSADNI